MCICDLMKFAMCNLGVIRLEKVCDHGQTHKLPDDIMQNSSIS